jgi:hypothetical protein
MAGYDDFSDNRIKHLEMLQAVIARLGSDSFLVKGWAVTIVGAFLAFAVNKDDASLAGVGLLPAIFFWGLDAYFLRAERLFRHLFDRVRSGADATEPFFMAATSTAFIEGLERKGHHETWWATLHRSTLLAFYGALVATTAVVAVVICVG